MIDINLLGPGCYGLDFGDWAVASGGYCALSHEGIGASP